MDIIVEENPSYPGLGFAQEVLIKLLSTQTRPKSMLVTINDVDYLFTQVLHKATSLQGFIGKEATSGGGGGGGGAKQL